MQVRDGDTRRITIQDGDPKGKKIIIVDDLVQVGTCIARRGWGGGSGLRDGCRTRTGRYVVIGRWEEGFRRGGLLG